MILSENRFPIFGIMLFAKHDLFRKPVPTFRGHALLHSVALKILDAGVLRAHDRLERISETIRVGPRKGGGLRPPPCSFVLFALGGRAENRAARRACQSRPAAGARAH